jgi:hypothetical protein
MNPVDACAEQHRFATLQQPARTAQRGQSVGRILSLNNETKPF